MSCGGCGSGARPQNVRRQVIEKEEVKPEVVQRRVGQAAEPVSIQRQYVMARNQCIICGYPTMVVTVANRERHQCSNVNCREIVQ